MLNKKVVLITGTGGGLGRVAAQTFAREGAKVVGRDIPLFASKCAWPHLVRRGGGVIVNIASHAGMIAAETPVGRARPRRKPASSP
jgi:NAD(P)-dependent dehydrogenase (short-subunit alcohol dehydrogenase family)